MYDMDYPKFFVSNQEVESIGNQRVKVPLCMVYLFSSDAVKRHRI